MSYNPAKCDPSLGFKVEQHLQRRGLQTPTIDSNLRVDDHKKIEFIRECIRDAMGTLGLNLGDDSLADTPNRIAKMWVRELMWGLDPAKFPKCTAIENKMSYDEMLIENDIKVMSLCEHHFVTIDGKASIAYIPKDKVIGLSKLNRVVDYFSRRPQVQERLTAQVMEALKFILGTENVAVSVRARHYCVISRGIEDTGSYTTTNALSGDFKHCPSTRQEFLQAIKG